MSIKVIKDKITEQPDYIDDNSLCYVKECGNHIEVKVGKINRNGKVGNDKISIVKLSKDDYINIKSGELCNFKHYEKRIDDTSRLAVTMKNIRNIINTNCVIPENIRFITLTYRFINGEPMTDTKKLYKDFHSFTTKLTYHYGKEIKYIGIVEPQSSGAWHIHLLLIFPSKAPYIENQFMADLWKQGFVNVRAVDNVDNIGAYVSAYLTDIPLSDLSQAEQDYYIRNNMVSDVDCLTDNGQMEKKKVVKHGRLRFYPSGMHLLRYSKNCELPIEYNIKYTSIKKEIGCSPICSFNIGLYDDDKLVCSYLNEYYNLNDLKKQGCNNDDIELKKFLIHCLSNIDYQTDYKKVKDDDNSIYNQSKLSKSIKECNPCSCLSHCSYY